MPTKSRNNPFIYNPPALSDGEVIYSDDYIIIANKPPKLLSVPGRGDELSDCLEARIRSRFADALTVHRLDMETSGIMIYARGKDNLRNLGLQFEKRKVSKAYIARLWGHIEEQSGRVSKPLRCDWPNRPLQMIDFDLGREAITDWELIGHEGPYSRVKLMPHTGRTHQLRVHMMDLGHPILGDDFYAHDEAYEASKRLELHAQDLTFHHPQDDLIVTFSASCPF